MAEGAGVVASVVRRRATLEPLVLFSDLVLGAGGEARVYALPGEPGLVAKVYHVPTIERARKVALMMERPPALDPRAATLAWPCDLLLGTRGRFAGFLMPRAEGPRLFELYNPSTRRRTAPLCHHGVLHRVGANLAEAFGALHGHGYVVGDVNESNVLADADGVVTLVDTDSFQVPDPEDGTVHRSRVGKPEFTPPELQGKTFADFDRAPEHDRFGLAVLLFLLLMEGTHPFAARTEDGTEPPPLEERILRGLFPHAGRADCRPPRMAPPLALLDPGLRALFVRAFVDGHAVPSARPSAEEWRAALDAAEGRMTGCAANARHRFGAHLEACPWCERATLLGGRDPFPERAEPPRPAPPRPARVPARRPAVAPVPAPAPAATPARAPVAIVAPAPGLFANLSWSAPGAALDAWKAQVLGPTGVRNPVSWLLPSLLMVSQGTGGLQVLAALGLLFVIWRICTRGVAPLGKGTTAATIVLLVGFSIFLSMLAGTPLDPGYASSSGSYDSSDPGDQSLARHYAPGTGPTVTVGEPYTTSSIDAAPTLLNRADMERRLSLFYRGMPDGESEVLVGVYVRLDGTVDGTRTDASMTNDPSAREVAELLAGEMRFTPLTVAGSGVEGRAWVSIRFAR